MRLAVQTPLVPGASLAEQWEVASRLGFDALELAGPGVPAQAEEARGTGIPVSALCGGQRGALIHPERARIEEFLADSPSLLDAAALGYVHLADSNRLEPGRGHTGFAATISALVTSGYDGTLGLECKLSTPGEATLRRVAQYLRGLMDAA